MKLELCIDTLEEAELACEFNLDRVELCSTLDVGGLTPSLGMICTCAAHKSIETHVMIRPRPGGFVYSKSELNIMIRDIEAVAQTGAKGVVFGILDQNDSIDSKNCEELVSASKSFGLDATFHRAFDLAKDPLNSLQVLVDLGFDRLLTSGQKPTAVEGIDLIRRLVEKSQQKIQIMAGSGVNTSNAVDLKNCGVGALHFTARKKSLNNLLFGMGNRTTPDKEKIRQILEVLRVKK